MSATAEEGADCGIRDRDETARRQTLRNRRVFVMLRRHGILNLSVCSQRGWSYLETGYAFG